MNYQDVVMQSIRSFMDGTVPEQTSSLKEGGIKYTPEFFDKLEKDIAEGKLDAEEIVEQEDDEDDA